jgi:hypothetical protein
MPSMRFPLSSLSDSLRAISPPSRRAPPIRRRPRPKPQIVTRPKSEGGPALSWPFLPGECPRCRYHEPFDEPVREDNTFGYEIVGLCLHPRIGMELFRRQLGEEDDGSHCPCFTRKRGSRRDTS